LWKGWGIGALKYDRKAVSVLSLWDMYADRKFVAVEEDYEKY
jgi:hypothetical protein